MSKSLLFMILLICTEIALIAALLRFYLGLFGALS
jgi:hypothetical protein